MPNETDKNTGRIRRSKKNTAAQICGSLPPLSTKAEMVPTMSNNKLYPEPRDGQGQTPGSQVPLALYLERYAGEFEDMVAGVDSYNTMMGVQIAQGRERTVVNRFGTQTFTADPTGRRGSEVKIFFTPECEHGEVHRLHAIVIYFHKGRLFAYVQHDAYQDEIQGTKADGMWRD